MSASLARETAPAAADPALAEELRGIPRKLTAARLLGALRRDPRFRDAFLFQDVIPYSAEPVLKAVCALVAASPEQGLYRPAETMRTRLPGILAAALKKTGAETAITDDLDALARAGLIEIADEGVVALPVDVVALTAPVVRVEREGRTYTPAEWEALTPKARASVANGRKGGRPKKAVPGQRSMPLMGVVAGTQGRNPAEPTAENPDAADGGMGSPPGFLAEAAAAEDDVRSSSEQQQQLTRAGETRETHGETHGPETHGPNPGVGTQAATLPLPPEGEALVARVVFRVAAALGLQPHQAVDGPDRVRAWLAAGIDPDRIVAIAANRKAAKDRKAAGGRPVNAIGSVSYLDSAMADEAGQGSGASRPGHRAAPPAVPPTRSSGSAYYRLRRDDMDTPAQFQLGVVIDAVEAGDLAGAEVRMQRLLRLDPKVAQLVMNEFPALRPAQLRATG